MDTKEKLVELINIGQECPDDRGPFDLDCQGCKYEKVRDCQLARLADYLIAHGVTVQEWISVHDRLPEMSGEYLVATVTGYVGVRHFYVTWPRSFQADTVTHWMPLPEPPKEG